MQKSSEVRKISSKY